MLGMTNYLTECFYLGVLVNVGKKVFCLQCVFKSLRSSRDIDRDYDVR